MLETIIIILLVLWLVGAFGWRGRGRRGGRWGGGNLIHILLVIVVVLLLIRLF
ncbi:MAG: lmo0937 family membrane protein [Anaerolineales bacterium]